MRPKKASAEPLTVPSACMAEPCAIEEAPVIPPSEAEILANDLLVQYLKIVKLRADGLDQGRVINVDTMNALKLLQETLWMLQGIGVLKPR